MLNRTRTALALLAVAILVAPPAAAQARMKVVLDTDIGTDIDDAWALGYALKSPTFDLLGVTVTDADTPQRAQAGLQAPLSSRPDRRARRGRPADAGRSARSRRLPVRLGGGLSRPTRRSPRRPSSSSPTSSARNPGQVTLIAVGPLQNIGDLVRQHPDVVPLVKRVVLMSGSIGPNAFSPAAVAEWNVKLAIPEAQAVYAAAWPLTIVPLDATTYVRLEDQEREALQKAGTPLVIALEALLRLWSNLPSSRMTLHDQLALAEAQQPGRFFGRCEPMPLRVDAEGYTRVDEAPVGR